MARWRYVRSPNGYTYTDLHSNVRVRITDVQAAQFHMHLKAYAALEGYAMKRVPDSLRRVFLESMGRVLAHAKRLPEGTNRDSVAGLLRNLAQLPKGRGRKQ